MMKHRLLSCAFGFGLMLWSGPGAALEQTKENWMNAVGGKEAQDLPAKRDAAIQHCIGKRDPAYRGEVARLTKQHLSESDHLDVMREYDTYYQLMQNYLAFNAQRHPKSKYCSFNILNKPAMTGITAALLGHGKYIHLLDKGYD